MSEREFWTKRLKEAERALDAATGHTALSAAAKRYMLAKAEPEATRGGNRAASQQFL